MDKASNPCNQYTILKNLGQGRNGQTDLAQTSRSVPQQLAVIKQIYHPQAPLVSITQRLQSLGQHPQLPALLDSWQTPKGQFFVFEYVTGLPITQAESPPWSPDRVEAWLLALLPVLEYLHSFRLIHGDLRPANIRHSKQPILVDCRITQRLDRQPRAVVSGDAAYAAPEQALGKPVYASDLYSLGLVAIHLMTGLTPFDLYSVADNRWIWPDLIAAPLSTNLGRVLPKLLEQSLEKRYVSSTQALADLKKSSALFFLDKARSLLPKDPLGISLPSLPKSTASVPQRALTQTVHWQPLYRFTTGITTALALQSNILAMGTNTGTVLVCDLANGDTAYSLEGGSSDRITALAFHPQASTLYGTCGDGTVKLWDLTSGNLIQALKQPGWRPTDVAIAPPHLVISDGTGHITLWDLQQLTVSHSFTQHQDWVSAIATNGERLASISRDRTLRLWSLSQKRLLETWSVGASRGLAIHPSGDYVIVGDAQGQITVWQLSSQSTQLCRVKDGITSLALSPDARLLAVGTDGSAVQIYEGASGQRVSNLPQGWGVMTIAFDGHTLVSSSQDETVTVWQKAMRPPM